jgi:hypothetical protein
MEESIKSAAAILGRMGGMAKSARKTAACRRNAKKKRKAARAARRINRK